MYSAILDAAEEVPDVPFGKKHDMFQLPIRRAGELQTCGGGSDAAAGSRLVRMRPNGSGTGYRPARNRRTAKPATAMPNKVIEPGSGAVVASRLEE